MERTTIDSNSGKMGFSVSRTTILAAFGFAGLGALVGAGSLYLFYIKNRLDEHFRIQAVISAQVKELQKDVEKLKRINNGESTGRTPRKKIHFEERLPGSKTSDEEFVTASSSESEYDEDAVVVYRNGKATRRRKETPAIDDVAVSEAGDNDAQYKQFLEKIDKLFEGTPSEQHDAYVALKANEDKLSYSCEFFWRFAKSTHNESVTAGQKDKEQQKKLLEHALSYADKALKLNENSSNAHKWYAIALGSLGSFLKIKDKIENGFVFKQHIDRAIVLNSKDSSLHHLLGRFCFEVSQLSWVERRMASALFASPPTATIQEALDHFLEAERIGKPFIDNRLFIGRCYISMGDERKAAHWLNLAAQIPVVTSNDKCAQQLVMELLPKYQKYLDS